MNKSQTRVAGAVLIVALESCGGRAGTARAVLTKQEQQAVAQSKFYCNAKALSPTERARHKVLTDKLVSQRTRVVEIEKGYEFQYSPFTISLAEVAEWVSDESKCCPFFGFHIDLENEGTLLCLRLTGEKGVKEFVRGEFLVSVTPS